MEFFCGSLGDLESGRGDGGSRKAEACRGSFPVYTGGINGNLSGCVHSRIRASTLKHKGLSQTWAQHRSSKWLKLLQMNVFIPNTSLLGMFMSSVLTPGYDMSQMIERLTQLIVLPWVSVPPSSPNMFCGGEVQEHREPALKGFFKYKNKIIVIYCDKNKISFNKIKMKVVSRPVPHQYWKSTNSGAIWFLLPSFNGTQPAMVVLQDLWGHYFLFVMFTAVGIVEGWSVCAPPHRRYQQGFMRI